ncbi:type II secretion system protein J [Candidatus Dependentiae bacterium]
MCKVKSGYILLELLIASAISAFVLGALFTSFNQANMALQTMDTISSIDMRILLLNNQLEKDISGAFVPFERKKQPLDTTSKKTSTKDDKGKQKSSTDKAKSDKPKEKFKDVPLKKGFLSKNKGENIELLTFITTNPIKAFANQKEGIKAKPRIARVKYTLVPEKERARGKQKRSFKLLRQEDFSIGFADFEKKKPRSYVLIKNIKKMSVLYTVVLRQAPADAKAMAGRQDERGGKDKGQKVSPDEQGKVEYKKFKKWGEDEIKKTKKNKPDLCTFKVELWDDLRRTSREFELKIYIVQVQQGKDKKEKDKQNQASGEKPDTSAGKTKISPRK